MDPVQPTTIPIPVLVPKVHKKEKKEKTKKEPKVPKVPKLKLNKSLKEKKEKVKKPKLSKSLHDPLGGTKSYTKRRYKKRPKVIHPAEVSPRADSPKEQRSPFIPYQLTTKDILDLVFLDHNYCQVLYSTNRSKVQPFRHLFGPKNEYKAKFVPETLISPNKFLPPVPPPPPPVTSKLEYLLKRGNDPCSPSSSQVRCSTPTPIKKYWEAHEETVEEIDVVTTLTDVPVPYDPVKAKNLMSQCEKHAKVIKPINGDENWEEQIVRTGWTRVQARLYDAVVKALHSERLARLTFEKHPSEPVLRRASLDRTARVVRRALHDVNWSTKLTQWLHGVLIEHLSQTYLASYLDVLQTLKGEAPALVDRMILLSTAPVDEPEFVPAMDMLTNTNHSVDVVLSDITSATNTSNVVEQSAADALKEVLAKKATNLGADALNLLLKKPWDPFSPVVHHTKMKKLACNPVFLYIPCVSVYSSSSSTKRYKNFCSMFAALGKVITLNIMQSVDSNVKVVRFAAKLLEVTKRKITDIRKNYPDRPLYLIGWGTGSILATTASVQIPVDGVIALAFPLFGLSGPRGTLEDPILDMKHPVLFVIGGRSPDASLTDMELLRKQLNCETSMVVIGSGNKDLRINRYHREKLLVTQSWVDKCIVDEVGYFINLHSKHQQVTAAAVMEKSTGKSYRKSGVPRNRAESICSNKSTDLKPPLYTNYASDCSMDGSIFDDAIYDDTVFAYDKKITPPSIKKPKRKSRPSVKKNSLEQSTDIVNSIMASSHSQLDNLSFSNSANWKNPTTIQKTFIKAEPDPDISSPVLNYLAKPPIQAVVQGGLLHGLLSPTLAAGPSEPLVIQNQLPVFPTTKPTKKTKPKTQKSTTPDGEKKKRPPRPKKPKPSVALSPAEQIGATVLAGGATATPVPAPVNPSVDCMRQYVLQHQQVMQKHLHQFQQQNPGQSQLLRLLSPTLIPSAPVPYVEPSSHISSNESSKPPQPVLKQVGGAVNKLPDVSLPADLSVFPMRPKEFQYSGSGEKIEDRPPTTVPPMTALISRQQLMSNLSTPLLRLSRVDPSSSNPLTGGESQSSQVPINMPCFTPNARANVFLKAADKTIATNLRQVDLKALFDGGVVRFVVPGEKGQNYPVNIILKQPLIPTTTTTVTSSNLDQQHIDTHTYSTPISAAAASQQTLNNITYSVMPQEVRSPGSSSSSTTTPVKDVSDSSQAFGQIFRSPVDSRVAGTSQVPVSVLMPKTYIAREPSSSSSSDVVNQEGNNNPSRPVKVSRVQKEPSQKPEMLLEKVSVPLIVPEPSKNPEEAVQPKISVPTTELEKSFEPKLLSTTTTTTKEAFAPVIPTILEKKEIPIISTESKVIVTEKNEISIYVEPETKVTEKNVLPITVEPTIKVTEKLIIGEPQEKNTTPVTVEVTKQVKDANVFQKLTSEQKINVPVNKTTLITAKTPVPVKVVEKSIIVITEDQTVTPEALPVLGKLDVIVKKKSIIVSNRPTDNSKIPNEPINIKTTKTDKLVYAVKTAAPFDEPQKSTVEILTVTEKSEDSIGQVKRSLRPKSYPGPKRKREASGSGPESRKRSKIVVTTVGSQNSESTEIPHTSPTEPKTPRKRDSQRLSGSSESNTDESVTPRLTRSMRRQSSTSGGT